MPIIRRNFHDLFSRGAPPTPCARRHANSPGTHHLTHPKAAKRPDAAAAEAEPRARPNARNNGIGQQSGGHTCQPVQRRHANSRQNARRKATFQPVKRGLLPCKRRQTGNPQTISHLQTAQQDAPLTATNARKTPPAKQPNAPTCGRRQPASRKQKTRWRHHDAIGLNSEYNLL